MKTVEATFGIHIEVVRLGTWSDFDSLFKQIVTAAAWATIVAQSENSAVRPSDNASCDDGIVTLNLVDDAKRLPVGVGFESTLRR